MTGKSSISVVVGATGYLGAHIAQKLSGTRDTVHAFGQKQSGFATQPLSNQINHTGDICHPETIEKIVDLSPDSVIYCVSLDQRDSEVNIQRTLDVNVKALWTLAHRLDQVIQRPIRFVYLSTAHVYGILNGTITEALLPQPRSAYGLTHLMCEQVLSRYADRGIIDPVSVRLSNGYGPPVSSNPGCWSLVVNDFCRSIVEKKRIQLSSDGTPQRDFVFVDDIADAISEFLRVPADKLRPVYNLASGQTKTMLELAIEVKNSYRNRTGDDCPIILGDGTVVDEERESSKPAVSRKFLFDNTAFQKLGGRTGISMDAGTNKLFDFLEGRKL